jgi:hypothetical protein
MGIGGKNEKQSVLYRIIALPARPWFARNISGKVPMHGKKPALRKNELSGQGAPPIRKALLKEVSEIADESR